MNHSAASPASLLSIIIPSILFIVFMFFTCSPSADILKPLLCMKTKASRDCFQLSTCLFKYWSDEEPRELANVVAHLLTKSANQMIKKRQGRYVLVLRFYPLCEVDS